MFVISYYEFVVLNSVTLFSVCFMMFEWVLKLNTLKDNNYNHNDV